jgi:hypothetical protein
MVYDIYSILVLSFDDISYFISKYGLWGSLITILSGIVVYFFNRFKKDNYIKEKFFEFYEKSENLKHEDFNIAKYREEYEKFEELNIIPNLLDEKKNFIITGRASSGKTRSVYEYLKVLKRFKIIKFYSDRIIKIEEIPDKFFKGKPIIFLDDLDEYVNKLNLNQLIKKLDLNSDGYIIVATCITGNNYDKAEEEFGHLKNIFVDIKIENEQLGLALKISNQLEDINFSDFDGTVGSMFLKLERMETI